MSDTPRAPDWIDGVLDEVILRCDAAGRILEIRGATALLPAAGAVVGARVADLAALPLPVRDGWMRTLARVGRASGPERVQVHAYDLARDGAVRSFEARMIPAASGEVVVVIRDVGERNRLRRRVEHLGLHDAVTGLGNLRVLREKLVEWTGGPGVAKLAAVALLIVDLDRFRQTNDLHGRSVGDSLLRLVAQRMQREALRQARGIAYDPRDASTPLPADDADLALQGAPDLVVVRVGGDQFAIAWRIDGTAGMAADQSDALAARLITGLAAPTRLAGRTLFVRASIGVALHPHDARDPSSLFSLAEAALMRAKQGGRNQFRRHGDEAVDRSALLPPNTEAALRDALAAGQFLLVYQLKFELASSLSSASPPSSSLSSVFGKQATDRSALVPGAVIAVEALCRWRTPSGALLVPQDFIPLAENTGMIRPLGDWVLRQALSEVTRFADRGAARVGLAVNVSLSQLHDRSFIDVVASALFDHGFAAADLTLEIAETAFLEDIRLVSDVLAELSALGVRLAIDHFGVGTAGLVALKSLPVDEIKIDRSFIAGAAIDAFDATIVAGLIELGHNLGMTVTADGVERVDQIAALAKLRCDAIQGYFVGEPLTADELVADAGLWARTLAVRGAGR